MKTLFLDEICEIISARCGADMNVYEVKGISTDSRTMRAGELFFAIKGEKFDGHDFVSSAFEKGAVGAVVEREPELTDESYRGRLLYVDDVIRAMGGLASYYRDELACTVIAITGSNGKTTTKEMIYHILSKRYKGKRSQKSFNNQIGVPLTLLDVEVNDEFLVSELGSNHPGEIDYLGNIVRPDIAVITQIGESHLEGFGSIDRVASEKASIVRHVRAGGAIVANGDNHILMRLISHPEATVFSFGTSEDNDMRVGQIVQRKGGIKFTVNGRFKFFVPVIGRHNAINCLAAIVVARRMGFEMDQINEALSDFRLPAMRLEVIDADGVTIINDAYNANPVSMSAAIDVLVNYPCRGRRIFCCGDMLELGSQSESFHRQLGARIGCSEIDVLIVVGGFAKQVGKEAISAGLKRENVFVSEKTEQVSEVLKSLICQGDVILIKGSRAMKMEKIIADCGLKRALPTKHTKDNKK